jgi:pimeloyl-ACP methyl ester carboxylesterase
VLLTHGFRGTARIYDATVAALGPSRRCITWDVRGHGDSDYPDDPALYSVDLTVADMVAILDAAAVDRAVLVGHSMGGYLSLELQRRHPRRVAALVLADTGPGYRRDDARAGWNDLCESFARALETGGPDGLPGSEEVDASAHRGVDGLVRAARGILTQHDAAVLDHLPAIDVPTLVVVGADDTPFVTATSYMAGKIPGARAVVIDGAGHAPMVTHGDEFNGELEAFLAEIDGRP